MIFSLDHLNETEFEEFCVDLLVELGFVNISWRKGTGLSSSPADQGRDIECDRLYKDDLDNTAIAERWFVECKHYQKGVPPEKLVGALSWATAEAPDKLLIITSNFLSNPAKHYLSQFKQNNKPRFRIKTWERPDIERLIVDNKRLIEKYRLGKPKSALAFEITEISDPLFMSSLAATATNSLLSSARIPLNRIEPFDGVGLYAIYYDGTTDLYPDLTIESSNLKHSPIYIGKTFSGHGPTLRDKGAAYSSFLYRRIKDHIVSIQEATNLDLKDFSCQYSVMAEIWAILTEPYLLDTYNPLWNTRISGFGHHNPGKGRMHVRKSAWDTRHPGRQWALGLQ